MTIDAIREVQAALLSRRSPAFPPFPWWRKSNTIREIDIGEHMYTKGAEFVLREWEMEERRRERELDKIDPLDLLDRHDPFDVEPSREPDE